MTGKLFGNARGLVRWLVFVLSFVCVAFASTSAWASHFRYGNIQWDIPDANNAPLTVRFTVDIGYRTSFGNASETFQFGDATTQNINTASATIVGTGTDSIGGAYTLYRWVLTHAYAADGVYNPKISSSARVGTLQQGANGSYVVTTQVALGSGNTSPPVGSVPSVAQLLIGGTRTIDIPIYDPDGDATTCRWGTEAETGLTAANLVPQIQPSGASASISNPSQGVCRITWDITAGTAGHLFPVHVMLESDHAGVSSHTAIDFIVEFVSTPPPTLSIAAGSVFNLNVGALFTTDIVAAASSPASTVTGAVTGAPSGSTSTPLSGTGTVTTTFSWTPGAGDSGTTRVVLFQYSIPSGTPGGTITGFATITLIVSSCPACSGNTPICNRNTSVCEACATDLQCAGFPGTTRCVTAGPNTGACGECDNNSHCSGLDPVCDPVHSHCDPCNGDFGSAATLACPSSAAPLCNLVGPINGACSVCTVSNSSACTGATPVCDVGTGTCTGCNGNFGSATSFACSSAALPFCQTSGPLMGQCTACGPGVTGQCVGTTPLCNETTGACTGCDGNFGSATPFACPNAGQGVCQTAGPLAGSCTQCSAGNTAACSGTTSACDTATGTCAGCNGDFGSAATLACPSALSPACQSNGSCTQCSATVLTQCTGSTPACNTSSGSCAACTADNGSGAPEQCPSTTAPFCLAGGGCALCTENGTGATGCTNGTPAHGGPICNLTTGVCGNVCARDSDCLSTHWCDTTAGVCTAKITNGGALPGSPTPIPNRHPSDPVLDGTCNPQSGAAACASGECNPADNRCGLTNQMACASAAVCRSNVCNPDGKCGDPNGEACVNPTAPGGVINECRSDVCFTDDLCGLPNGQRCLASGVCRSVCVPVDNTCGLLNGSPCSAASDCRSGVCHSDGLCGLPNNQACSLPGGNTICRSGTCQNNVCGANCADDTQCVATSFCDATSHACVADYPNGEPSTGSCDRGAQCTSGVCHSDGKCGLPDGQTCAAALVCRSGSCNGNVCGSSCGTDDAAGDANCQPREYCKAGASGAACSPDLPNGDPCARAGQCMSGTCASDAKCGVPDGGPCADNGACRGASACVAGICASTGCTSDAQCGSAYFCSNPGASGVCTSRKANGDPCTRAGECVTNVCNADQKCGQPLGEPCGDDLVCRSNKCNPSTNVCVQCASDSECGSASSGRICDSLVGCINGCRGTGGNGCPAPAICSSTTSAAGTCSVPDAGAGDAGVDASRDASIPFDASIADATIPDGATVGSDGALFTADGAPFVPGTLQGGGCGCRTVPRTGTGTGLLALGSLAAALLRRRARKRAA